MGEDSGADAVIGAVADAVAASIDEAAANSEAGSWVPAWFTWQCALFALFCIAAFEVIRAVAPVFWKYNPVFRGAHDLPKRYGCPGCWAVVTGASSGIGRAYAILLAKQGFNVVLIARRRDRLIDVATEIEELHGVGTLVLDWDLSMATPAAMTTLVSAMGNRPVGLLVLNAATSEAKLIQQQEKSLRAGCEVTLHGLQSAAAKELNAQTGILEELIPESGRWRVKLNKTGDKKDLKPENMTVTQDAEATYHFMDAVAEQNAEMVRLHCLSVVLLLHKLLPRMVRRPHRCGIITFGGLSATIPMPQFQVAAASKAFIRQFTLTTGKTLEPRIDFTCAHPFAVERELVKGRRFVNFVKRNFVVSTPDQFCEATLRHLGYSRETFGNFYLEILHGMWSLLPDSASLRANSAITRLNNSFFKQAAPQPETQKKNQRRKKPDSDID